MKQIVGKQILGWGVLATGLVLGTGCGFNGATITARPDAGRNVKPADTDTQLPTSDDDGDAAGPVVGPVVVPRPPKDPKPVFEARTQGQYTVTGEVLRVAPVGGMRRKLQITLDVQVFEEVQTNRTRRIYEDQTDFLTGYATVRGSALPGMQPARFVVRLERDARGHEVLLFSEASARRLMRALLPGESARGELDLRAEGGLVLARYGAVPLVSEASVLAGGLAVPMAFTVAAGPLAVLAGMPPLVASQMGGVCNPSHSGNIRMLSRDLLWRSWSSPNLVEYPECR